VRGERSGGSLIRPIEIVLVVVVALLVRAVPGAELSSLRPLAQRALVFPYV
jgi:hypothetical protein